MDSAVESLIVQAGLLGEVEAIICVGGDSRRAIARRLPIIRKRLGKPGISVFGIPHYSRANGGKHKHKAEVYRALVGQALGLT